MISSPVCEVVGEDVGARRLVGARRGAGRTGLRELTGGVDPFADDDLVPHHAVDLHGRQRVGGDRLGHVGAVGAVSAAAGVGAATVNTDATTATESSDAIAADHLRPRERTPVTSALLVIVRPHALVRLARTPVVSAAPPVPL